MKDIDESKAPLIEHLIELRRRLVWSVLALVLSFIACYNFADEIFGILVQPLHAAFGDGNGKLIYTKLYEAFFVRIKVALFAAFFISFPIIASQIWLFVAPGLYANEKKAFLPFMLATPLLFIAGSCLAYFFVMPTAMTFFIEVGEGEIGGMGVEALPSMGDYLTLVMQFILVFGISFLLPVLLLLLNRAGIVDREMLVKARRYVIVIAFVIAAITTPPDPISQLLLAIPLVCLFEGSLLIMRLTDKKSADAKEAPEAETPA